MFLLRKKKRRTTILEQLYKGLVSPLNDVDSPGAMVSSHVLEVAMTMRGTSRPPAIFLHGVMPRSGTVYFGEVLSLHPDIYPHPNKLWELPFLAHADDLITLQEKYFQTYQQNRERMGENGLLCLFGSGIMNYLHSFVPEGKTMLVKSPRMQFLTYFTTFFPYENLVVLMRDGRDVVQSTIKTWPERNYVDVCREWEASTRIYLRLMGAQADSGKMCFVKYEDLLSRPVDTAIVVFMTLGMRVDNFPAHAIESLPVRGSSSNRSEGHVSWEPVERNNSFSPGGGWRHWNSREKDIFKSICGNALIELGYTENLDW